MKPPVRRSFLSLLPLPLLAGWFLTSQPPQADLVDHPTATAPTPLYPPPQVDASSPPEDLPPTF